MKPIANQRPRSLGVRTPLMAELRRMMRLATLANEPSAPPADELAEMTRARTISRRECLLGAGSVLLGGAGPTSSKSSRVRAPTKGGPRIVVVGAGIAGLNATYQLKKAGLSPTLFSAGERLGGRIASHTGAVAPGVTSELGGEFIDTGHDDMHALVR
jgi:monoamine oxidase